MVLGRDFNHLSGAELEDGLGISYTMVTEQEHAVNREGTRKKTQYEFHLRHKSEPGQIFFGCKTLHLRVIYLFIYYPEKYT